MNYSASDAQYQQYKHAFAAASLPCAYLDLDHLAANIATVVQLRGNKRIRLASKSIRSVGVLQRILAADTAFQGVMAFAPREAVYLAQQGIGDIVLGYPCTRRVDIDRIAALAREQPAITLMVDSITHVDIIEQAAKQHGVRLPIWIDIDMATQLPGLHFGSWRSGITSAQQLQPLLDHIRRAQHVVLEGVMGYEAQIAGVPDRVPGQALMNSVIRILKAYSARVSSLRRRRLVQAIRASGVTLRAVNGGGTGSMRRAGRDSALTELTIGSGLYGPTLFDQYQRYSYRPAAGLRWRLCARPARASSPALAAAMWPLAQLAQPSSPRRTCPSAARSTRAKGPARSRHQCTTLGRSRLRSAIRSSFATPRLARSASTSQRSAASLKARLWTHLRHIEVMVSVFSNPRTSSARSLVELVTLG